MPPFWQGQRSWHWRPLVLLRQGSSQLEESTLEPQALGRVGEAPSAPHGPLPSREPPVASRACTQRHPQTSAPPWPDCPLPADSPAPAHSLTQSLTEVRRTPVSRGRPPSSRRRWPHSRSGSPAGTRDRRCPGHRALGTGGRGGLVGRGRSRPAGCRCLRSGTCRASGSPAPRTGCCKLEPREMGGWGSETPLHLAGCNTARTSPGGEGRGRPWAEDLGRGPTQESQSHLVPTACSSGQVWLGA